MSNRLERLEGLDINQRLNVGQTKCIFIKITGSFYESYEETGWTLSVLMFYLYCFKFSFDFIFHLVCVCVSYCNLVSHHMGEQSNHCM